jgi:hypothetical protein
MKLFLAIAILSLSSFAFGQAKVDPPKPSTSTTKVATLEDENAILKAEHDLDQANLVKQQAQDQFLQLQKAYQEADKRAQDAQKSLNEAIEEAWKKSGLPRDEFAFDPANFTFVKRPPSEVKKGEGKK